MSTEAASLRSIPAGAGEPPIQHVDSLNRAVYPRGCGGTVRRALAHPAVEGLSPRVRGNPKRLRHTPMVSGSIPAGAGEPVWPVAVLCASWVYPRGCGGTSVVSVRLDNSIGLSPRVRGNRLVPPLDLTVDGSIPAGAGEPSRPSRTRPSSPVYPRGCGGTGRNGRRRAGVRGLSPRVRGNPSRGRLLLLRLRSIPAGAGEPQTPMSRSSNSSVYPRGCGGTRVALALRCPLAGLSPRVRGNPDEVDAVGQQERSIPAGAGEPSRTPSSSS